MGVVAAWASHAAELKIRPLPSSAGFTNFACGSHRSHENRDRLESMVVAERRGSNLRSGRMANVAQEAANTAAWHVGRSSLPRDGGSCA